MANPLYARLQSTAGRLIARFGQSGTLTRSTKPDAVLGGEPVGTPYPVTLVPMTYEACYVNGTTITTADRQIYISAVGLNIVPSVGDLIMAAGVEYHIVANDPNNYDGVMNVVHIVQGRIA